MKIKTTQDKLDAIDFVISELQNKFKILKERAQQGSAQDYINYLEKKGDIERAIMEVGTIHI